MQHEGYHFLDSPCFTVKLASAELENVTHNDLTLAANKEQAVLYGRSYLCSRLRLDCMELTRSLCLFR